MKKIFGVLLLVILALVGFQLFRSLGGQSLIPLIQSDKGIWKYVKTIPSPLTAVSKSGSDIAIGDITTNKVSVVIPDKSFDSSVAVKLQTPESVPDYIKSEMTPIGSPIEITAGTKHLRLNERARVTLAFDPSTLPKDTQLKDIRFLYHDGATWEFVRPTSVDMTKGIATLDTYHFSFFGLNKVDDETKITEAWIHSAAFDKALRDGINEKSDYIANQIVDMMLKKMGISDESAKGKIIADILKDDGYKDVVKAYASGDIVDGGQKVAALAGSKIVEFVPESTLSKALGSIAGSPEDIEAAGKALGNIAAGQYKDAAKIIGEQIADKFLITTAGKIAVEVINVQIESWKNAEVEAAFTAYKNGANGAFWGYNVDKKDFDAVWTQMKGASRQLELEAIAKENEIRAEAGMPTLTEAEADAVRSKVKESYRTQFETRLEKDAEIQKNEENFRAMVGAFKNANFFSGALAPAGLDKGMDYENTLDVLSHFMTKMMNDTQRFDLSDKTGLLVTGKLSLEDLVQGARYYFGAKDTEEGKKAYAKFLFDRFGILPYPPLLKLVGSWKGSMTVTDVYVDPALKNDKEALKKEGCDFDINFEEMKGKTNPIEFTLAATSETSGTLQFSSGKDAKSIAITYTNGVIAGSYSEKGATVTLSLTATNEKDAYGISGSMKMNFKDKIRITSSVTAAR